MPDGTAYLQGPDTHWNGPYKGDIRGSKAEVQHLGEVAAHQQGAPYNAQWGLGEIAETLSRAKDKLVATNDKTRLVLRAGIENQQTIYRPDEHGVLELVSDQKWFQEAGLRLDPPSKGIKPVWARRRRYLRSQWVMGAFQRPTTPGSTS